MAYKIFFDDFQEGSWFKSLNPAFDNVELLPITGNESNPLIARAMAYDRPDIILTNDTFPLLVLERTVEVPTGHNVGQRFARLAAAGEVKVPLVYFGPFMARKHGGATAGPRYMNLRLFYALDAVERVNNTVVTTINWPVDSDCELVRDASKDSEMKKYLDLLLETYEKGGFEMLAPTIRSSKLQTKIEQEKEEFISKYIRDPEQYDIPPPSVTFISPSEFKTSFGTGADGFNELLVYNVGMTYVRSDPYTGTGMLYRYLYILGEPERNRGLILHFPNISLSRWRQVSSRPRKDVRLFRIIADGIVFSDGYLKKTDL